MGFQQVSKYLLTTAMLAWPFLVSAVEPSTEAATALLTQHYKDGWVLDNFQGMAHSESMGVGLLAAVHTGNAAKFQALWKNTQKLQRDDGLFSWQYDVSGQKITDLNNASDGEIYIAAALFKAATRFREPQYRNEALRILGSLKSVIVNTSHGTVLLPGLYGFETPHPVVNLSYYVYPAFNTFYAETQDSVWKTLTSNGLAMTEYAYFGRYKLPPDWLALSNPVSPWKERKPLFGYDAIRVPLYVYKVSPTHSTVQAYKAFSLLNKPTVDLNTDDLADYKAPPGMQAIAAYVRGSYRYKASKDYYDNALQVMIEAL